MQHETKMENQSWLKKLARRLGPGHVVNLCFIVVLLFSTLLTWREVVVLEDAYISSQRNHLENVANALDKHLQDNVDKLIFLRNGMREALVAPLDFTSLRNAVTEFEQHRDEHAWQIELNRRRTLPVNGVSDALVSEGNLLSRENESLDNEITAALEVGYLLRLAHNSSSMVEQAMYVSRAGFYVSTQPTLFTRNVPTRYYGYVTQPWFIGHSQRENRHRAVRWFTSQPEHASNTEPQVTVSVPVDSNNYWYGVLGMSIPVRTMQQFLRNAIDKNLDGEYQLYDSKLRLLTSSNPDHPTGNIFNPRELALLAQAMEHDTRGGIRMDSRYVSWERLDHFDGVLVRVHTLSEGVRGDFGSISIALTLLWALFTTMLLISWYVIRRMVSNMYVLQSSLQWQAWHDTLTRLYNRGALFEKARPLAKLCQTHQHPFSVIQVDLDHFKAINDRFGHQAGDRVLSHAAGLISSSLRAQDVAGRVGGEEFCVILPGASLTEAAEVAERIRLKLNEKEMLIAKSTTIRISASLGVSSSEETGDYDFEQFQSLATVGFISLNRLGVIGYSRAITLNGRRKNGPALHAILPVLHAAFARRGPDPHHADAPLHGLALSQSPRNPLPPVRAHRLAHRPGQVWLGVCLTIVDRSR